MRFIVALFAPLFLAGQYPLDPAKEGITLPRTHDRFLHQVLASPRTTYYHMRQVYQHKDGLHTTDHLQDFNANRDFPWEGTLGLNAAIKRKDNPYGTINLLHLPEGKRILVIPENPVKWIFPEGAVAGEIIYVTYEGKKYTQEIRLRTKTNTNYWEPGIYRPFENRADFIHWAGLYDYQPAKKFFFLRNPEEDQVARLEGQVERLPNLSPDLVKRLLTLSFKDVTQEKWSATSAAPSADIDFHIVPKDYSLGVIRPSVSACMQCHRQTGIRVSSLIPNEPMIRNDPDKVGRIRGYDGIFTWHPFDDKEVPKRVLRKNDHSFIVFSYDMLDIDGNAILNGNRYVLTREVEDSLKGNELPAVMFRNKRPEGKEYQSLIFQQQIDRLEALIKQQQSQPPPIMAQQPQPVKAPKQDIIVPQKTKPSSDRWIFDTAKQQYYRLLEPSEVEAARVRGLRYDSATTQWVDANGRRFNYDSAGRYWWRQVANGTETR